MGITNIFAVVFHKEIINDFIHGREQGLDINQCKVQHAHGLEVWTLVGPKAYCVDVLVIDDGPAIIMSEYAAECLFCKDGSVRETVGNDIESCD